MSPPRLRSGFAWRSLLPVLFVLFAVLIAWPNGAYEEPGNPRSGRDLFVRKGCIRCHSIWESSSKKGPNLATVGMGRNLYELCASVWSHWSRMNVLLEQEKEARISLTASEFRDIIAYLSYVNYNSQPGEPQLGEEIFLKKGCVRCHPLEPLQAKGKPGRAVYEMQQDQDAVTLAVAVWNHGTTMFQTMSKQRIQWPDFKDQDVSHLVSFIRSRNGAVQETAMVVPGDPSRGQVLFATKSCFSCHRSGAQVSHPGPNIVSSGVATSLCSLIASLWNHYPKMSQAIATSGVSYPKITKAEMEDLLAYIYWLKAYGLAGNAKVGRSLYQSKQCASCHSPPQANASVAPSLVNSETTKSAYALLAAIWNHGPRMESQLRERKIPWPSLSGDEMRDLVAYFREGKADGPESAR